MEQLLVLAALILIAMPVALIYLLISHSRLKTRVAQLQRQIATPDTPVSDPVPEPEIPAARRIAARKAPPSDPVAPPDAVSVPPRRKDDPPRAVVFRADRFAALAKWLRDNWFYAVSALSLALAGIFLVQYGMESGLLPPMARVVAALGFGALLIGAGEAIRRRFGDDETTSTAYLPSTFSGAGIVTLFGAILSARLLYGLIGAETALVGLIAVALLAIVLGWFHGPLLAAVGVIGAFAAPFVVGGSSDDPGWLLGYFAVIAAVGLSVDAIRRWGWISVLTLALAYGAGWLIVIGGAAVAGPFGVYATALALLAIALPVLSLRPAHSGALLSGSIRKSARRPAFPTLLATGALLASLVALVPVSQAGAAEFWLSVICLALLFLALTLWCADAPALADLAALPVLALLAVLWLQPDVMGAWSDFTAPREPESRMPLQATWLVALGLALSLAAAWRSLREGGLPGVGWAAGAAIIAPAMAIMLEIRWQPTAVIGAYPWALHAAAIAGAMVALAERFARVDGADRLRMSFAVLSALSALAFACVILLSSAALTVAFAVTVLAAAALDARFGLPVMTAYIAAGVVTLGYRLLVDPGLDWAARAPLGEMVTAYGGTLAALVGALVLVAPLGRRAAQVMLESAAWTVGGTLASLLLGRLIERLGGMAMTSTHWALSLHALIWLAAALAQMHRRQLGGRMNIARSALAAIFALAALGPLLGALTLANPLFDRYETVLGPPVLNTLAVAYLLPALVLGGAAWRMGTLPALLRRIIGALAVALGALWLGLAIRHFWQGGSGMALGRVSQPELYSYTVALLAVGAGLFYQSLARGSAGMRRAGLVVIGLAVAKVFFVDISGLGGLTRVFSLLALGLSLAALAWLNRWAQGRAQAGG